MNNIYVDELPKSCRGCLFQCYGSCLGGRDILNGNPYTEICHLKRQKPIDCPLKTLSDRLAEERKKVVQEIRNKVEQAKFVYEWKGDEAHIQDILDQIERGE